MSVETAYQYLFLSALIVLGILIGIVLIRSIIGPRITDRILCINVIGTLVICSIAILSQRQHEGYLVDISLIYAMISFLTVLILASVYIQKKSSPGQETGAEGKPEGSSKKANESGMKVDESGMKADESGEAVKAGKEDRHG